MDIGRKIAAGREAEIYELPSEGHDEQPKVLKLFFADRSVLHVNNELAISKTVCAAGFPAPAVFGDVVEFNGRFGIVYQRVPGTDMLLTALSRPWKAGSFGRELGTLHARLHGTASIEFAGLPRLKDQLERKISDVKELSEPERLRVLEILADLPDRDRIYHGDFHPGNVIVGVNGQHMVLDWANAGTADPLADVARTWLLISIGWRAAPQRATRIMGRWLSSWFLRSYLKAYFASTGAEIASIDRWRTVTAAARLSENIPAETKHLVKMVRSGLVEA